MKQPKHIEHSGIVSHVGRNYVSVTVEVNEACGSCASRKACAMGKNENRDITIYTDEAQNYTVGENVTVLAQKRVGIMAVVLCYVVPLIVLMMALILTISLGGSEGVAAMAALLCTAIYYVGLGLFHKRIAKRVTFTITKKDR